jgi:hypothetical protein
MAWNTRITFWAKEFFDAKRFSDIGLEQGHLTRSWRTTLVARYNI